MCTTIHPHTGTHTRVHTHIFSEIFILSLELGDPESKVGMSGCRKGIAFAEY